VYPSVSIAHVSSKPVVIQVAFPCGRWVNTPSGHG
jgi:hypothetical protein